MNTNTDFTANILRIWLEADETSMVAGMTWYSRAMDFARELDPENPHRAAGVIAALSPMLSWARNRVLAQHIYNGGRDGCLSANITKAVRILDGESPESVLSGPKVRAFYFNIVGVGSVETVTIDRHTIDIAVGSPLPDSVRATYMGKRKRADIASAYVKVADILSEMTGENIMPFQVQAVTWVYWRQNYAQAYHGE